MSVSDSVSATSSATIQAAGSTYGGQGQGYGGAVSRPLKRAREVDDDASDDVVGTSSSLPNSTSSSVAVAAGLTAGAGKTYGSGTYGRPAPVTKPPSPRHAGGSNVNGSSNGHAAPISLDRPAASTPASSSSTTLAPSFFGVVPPSDFVREIGDWIWGWCHNRTDVEVCCLDGLFAFSADLERRRSKRR